MKFKIVYNMRLAGFLMQKGYVLMNISENEQASGKKVFFFKYTNGIEVDIQKYLNNR